MRAEKFKNQIIEKKKKNFVKQYRNKKYSGKTMIKKEDKKIPFSYSSQQNLSLQRPTRDRGLGSCGSRESKGRVA